MEFNGASILVTGGSSGIGKSLAEKLSAKGAHVYITGRDAKKLEKAASALGGHALHADMARDADLHSAMDTILQREGKLDALINNAGIGAFGPVESLQRADFQRIFEVNVFGAAILGALAAEHFKERKKGHIMNVGSSASLKGFPNGSVYAASKFALRALSECWRAELRPFNVRVTHVNPSEVTTAFGREDRVERSEQDNRLRAEEIAHMMLSCLELDDRGFVPEFGVWATNPF